MDNNEELDNTNEQLIGEGEDGFQEDEPSEQSEYSEESEGPKTEASAEPIEQEKKIRKEIDKSRYNKIKRERYEAMAEVKRYKEEVEKLRKEAETYSKAAMTHYDNSVNLRLQQAEDRLSKAIEDGDVEAQTKAQKELARVTAEEVSVNSWKEQQRYNQEQQQQYQQAPQQHQQEVEINDNMHEWLSQNQWIIPDSEDYDPEMAEEVVAYAKALDRRYARNGQSNKISTPEYFNEINNYVQTEFYGQKPQEQRRNINMKPVNTNVAPVGKPTRQSSQTVKMSPADQRMARLLGKTDEEYLPFVIQEREKTKNRIGLHGGF